MIQKNKGFAVILPIIIIVIISACVYIVLKNPFSHSTTTPQVNHSSDSRSYTTYTSPLGFSFKYPESWHIGISKAVDGFGAGVTVYPNSATGNVSLAAGDSYAKLSKNNDEYIIATMGALILGDANAAKSLVSNKQKVKDNLEDIFIRPLTITKYSYDTKSEYPSASIHFTVKEQNKKGVVKMTLIPSKDKNTSFAGFLMSSYIATTEAYSSDTAETFLNSVAVTLPK
jgi:hypothetical protein